MTKSERSDDSERGKHLISYGLYGGVPTVVVALAWHTLLTVTVTTRLQMLMRTRTRGD